MKVDLKTVQDLGSPNLKECPYCGSDEFYYKQKMSGMGNMFVRYDGETAENGDMHDCLKYTPIGKFAYCGICHNRVFRFKR